MYNGGMMIKTMQNNETNWDGFDIYLDFILGNTQKNLQSDLTCHAHRR